MCNDEAYTEDQQFGDKAKVVAMVANTFGILPPGFFINGDPRGYALKIDNELSDGKALIDAVKLQTDMGGFGILSPDV